MKSEDEVWDAFGKAFGKFDEGFKEADKGFDKARGLFRTMGRRVSKEGVAERQDGHLVVPLTFKNRMRLIRLALCRAKKVRF